MTDPDPAHRLHVPLDPGDPWPQRTPQDTMAIDRTLPDHTRPDPHPPPRGCPAGPPSFLAEGSFWWDGSQIYGSDRDWQHVLRSHVDGKLRLTSDNRLFDLACAPDPRLARLAGLDLTGFPAAGGPG